MILITRIQMIQVISIDNKRNHHVTDDEQQLALTYSDSTTSFLYKNKDSQQYIDNNDNHNRVVHDLDLPYGLIDLLIKNNYTPASLINTDPSELSNILAIDQEVAVIILAAAKKKKRNNKHRKMHSSHRT